MNLIKRILLGWRITLPIGERKVAIPVVLSAFMLCCCCPLSYIFADVAVRQAGLAPTYTPQPTRTKPPTSTAETPEPAGRELQVALPTVKPEAILTSTASARPNTSTPEPTLTPKPLPTGAPIVPTATEPPPMLAPPTAAPSPTPPGPTAGQNGNLRAGPGVNYPVAGSIRAGQPLDITGRNGAGDWYQLANGNWIAGFLVRNAPATVPAAANIPLPPAATAPPIRSAPVIAIPTSSLPTASDSNCDCSANIYNCGDFTFDFDAQACYLRCMETTGHDVHDLDRDHDGSACEWDY